MCRPTTCRICGRTTWAGCGSHVAQVRARVPAPDWCGGQHDQAEIDAAASSRGFLDRLLGR